MKERRLAYFDATAEFLLDQFKKQSDLPADVRVIRIEAEPAWTGGFGKNLVVRFYVESDSFDPIQEGSMIARLSPSVSAK